jgi:hypothetical protein
MGVNEFLQLHIVFLEAKGTTDKVGEVVIEESVK